MRQVTLRTAEHPVSAGVPRPRSDVGRITVCAGRGRVRARRGPGFPGAKAVCVRAATAWRDGRAFAVRGPSSRPLKGGARARCRAPRRAGCRTARHERPSTRTVQAARTSPLPGGCRRALHARPYRTGRTHPHASASRRHTPCGRPGGCSEGFPVQRPAADVPAPGGSRVILQGLPRACSDRPLWLRDMRGRRAAARLSGRASRRRTTGVRPVRHPARPVTRHACALNSPLQAPCSPFPAPGARE